MSETKKKNRIFILTRLIKQCNDIIPQKNIQILDVKQQMSLLVKDLKVLKEDIIELEQTTEPLELEIQEIKNLNDQVTKNAFTYIIKVAIKNNQLFKLQYDFFYLLICIYI